MNPLVLLAQTDAAAEPRDVDALDSILDTLYGLWEGFLGALPKLAIAIVVFVVVLFIGKLIRRGIRKSTSGGDKAALGQVLGRMAQIITIAFGLVIAIAIVAPSVKPVDLLGLLGVSSVAIGFAFKDILQNFLAGILILLRQPFEVGDQIIHEGFEGTVESIETRATFIRTYDGRRVLIPNGEMYTHAVTVNTAYEHRRSQYDVGIGYGDDLEEASRIMLETLKGVEGVLAEPAPDVIAVDLAGSSVNLRARWWTSPEQAEVMKTTNRVITAIKLALDDAAIDMPYPTQVHLFHDQTEATDGDRTAQREGWPAGDNPPKSRAAADRERGATRPGDKPSDKTEEDGDAESAA